jgi:hypothetical protein
MPPPNTRSSSATPLGLDVAACPPTSVIGRAAVLTGFAAVRTRATPTGSTVPHAWHWPQRPAHLAASHPHSAHRWRVLDAGPLDVGFTMMARYGTPPTPKMLWRGHRGLWGGWPTTHH